MITLVRWIARILGTLSVLFFLALVFGEGLPNLFKLTATEDLSFLCMTLLFAGLGLAWFREDLSGALTLAAFGALVAISRSYLHMPAVQIPAAVGALHLVCWYVYRRHPRELEIPRPVAVSLSAIFGVFLLLWANEIFGNPPLTTPALRPGADLIGTWSSGGQTLTIRSDGTVSGAVTGTIRNNRTWFGRLMHWRTDYMIPGAGPFDLHDSELRGMGTRFRRIQ